MSRPWVSRSEPYLAPRPGGADAWAEEARRAGGVGRQQLREVAEVMPPVEVAAALGTADGEPVIVRRRLMLLDDKPVELTDSYYPLAIARGTPLAEPRKIRGGAVAVLAGLDRTPREVEEEVGAREPTAGERSLLMLGDREWVLVLSRLVRDSTGGPVECSLIAMPATRRRFRYQLTM